MNRLAREQSPYLLQHAANPVDWYPWGEEAFVRARTEDKPIFLSIGYSTCHWCHVMERESFEDPEVAALMNDTFINIKVDREERPDLDGIYMAAAQMLGTRGGWPLTIIMTPDQRPFYAATYLPKYSLMGRVGMMDLAPRIRELWRDKRDAAEKVAGQVTAELNRPAGACAGEAPGERTLDQAYDQLASMYDSVHGGFSTAPKFPTPHQLTFLLRYARRTGKSEPRNMAETTLAAMRRGGIYDHVGGGFHRYSTDREWLVPHFEKMLYDQAQLIAAYADAYLVSGRAEFERAARETIAYTLRDLASPDGAFYSAEDADSEGVEGKFYVWTEAELRAVLPAEDADWALRTFNVRPEGNFRDEATGRPAGTNILHLKADADEAVWSDPRMERVRQALLAARQQRVRPRLDDKVLADWNGLMIAALARAARAFSAPEYAAAAARAARFILSRMRTPDGRLWHRFRGGEAAVPGFLDDYAFLALGLLDLYEATFEVEFLDQARGLGRDLLRLFRDEGRGGLFLTAHDAAPAIARTQDAYDGAVPSGNSAAAMALLRLGRITADPELERDGEAVLRSFFCQAGKVPAAYTALLSALDFALGPTSEVVIAASAADPDAAAMIAALGRDYGPNRVVVFRPEKNPEAISAIAPYVAGIKPIAGRATAYVCKNYRCQLPTTDPAQMIELLSSS